METPTASPLSYFQPLPPLPQLLGPAVPFRVFQTSPPASPPATTNGALTTETSLPQSSGSGSSVSTGAKAGIAIACVLLFLSLLVGIWFYIRRRRSAGPPLSPRGIPTARGGGAGPGGVIGSDQRAWKDLHSVEHYDAYGGIVDEHKSYRNSGVSDLGEKPYQYPPHDSAPAYPTAAVVRTLSSSSRLSNPYADRHSVSSVPAPATPTSPNAAPSKVGSGKGRKPVPTYDASEIEQTSGQNTPNPFSSRPSSISHSTDHHEHEDLSAPAAPALPQFTKELQHKASFGEKAMHVLIPDMPPRRVASPPIHMR